MYRYRQEFEENGFTVVPGMVSPESIREVFVATFLVYRKFNKASRIASPPEFGFADPDLNAEMIQLRAHAPRLFGAMYDSIQTSYSMIRLTSERALADMAAELLNQPVESLAVTGHMVRMDPPVDRRNALDWHQEASYYKQNLVPEHGIVAWLPLRDLRLADGPLMVCPGSHKLGLIEVATSGKANYMTSEQYLVPREIVARYEPHHAVMNAGDVMFFHMCMFHRSGENYSQLIRFASGVRFHEMLKEDFVPGRLIYKANDGFPSI